MPELNTMSFLSDANLVSYWRLEGNATDEKAAHNGTATYVYYGTQYGIFGQGAHFSGAPGSKILLANSSVPTGAAAKSWNAWFRTSDTTARYRIICVGGSVAGGKPIFMLTVGRTHKLETQSGSEQDILMSTSYVNDGIWHMGTLTYDGTTLKMYLDGVLCANSTTTLTTDIYCGIGCLSADTTANFIGDIDDVSLYSDALTQAEITALWQNSYVVNNLKNSRNHRLSFGTP
jgi:hypothetical protein